jgi:hypothetical protein
MTDEQINAAIAEACGWTVIGECTCGFKLHGWRSEKEAHKKHIPNYCNDLNSMHEVEKTLVQEVEWAKYCVQLAKVTNALWSDDMNYVCATASHRAEAFLRTLGKWEEAVVNESFTTEEAK